MDITSRYIVILAGGKGERLWPLSREKKPKQLLSLDDQNSLLERTVMRASLIVEKHNIFIMTTEQQVDSIKSLLGDSIGGILSEPIGRNTAPALLLATLYIQQKDPSAIIAFLPADAFIVEDDQFAKHLNNALEFSQAHDAITLLGIRPDFPATNYGYIEMAAQKNDVVKVSRFHEKPSAQLADVYSTMDTMLWNIGIFCAKSSVFIEEYNRHAQQLYKVVCDFFEHKADYKDAENISIDYAVLEKSNAVYVQPCSFTWSDVGNLEIFLSLHKKHSQQQTEVIELHAANNIVQVPKKLVALIGVEDLCVVETDDVLLIAKRDQTDKVKHILHQLREKNSHHYT
ncbi:MAG: mannose-1-phosphate guanylyltransferase [Candidatus Babeliales bacterium]